MSVNPNPRKEAQWIRAATNDADFAREQQQLAHLWHFVAYLQDIPHDNDWKVAHVAGRSIVIQRVSGGVRGFENVCKHRFHPVCKTETGHGMLKCGYHGWQYDQEGRAVVIPQCKMLFDQTPAQMDVRLDPVQVAVCGSLIFARFGDGPDLKTWLGDSHALIAQLSGTLLYSGEVKRQVRSHWKHMMEITLDDYHVVEVHPDSFGKLGYLTLPRTRYYPVGEHHSVHIPSGDDDVMVRLQAQAAEGKFQPFGYMIFQYFPTLVFVVFHAVNLFGDAYWYVMTEQMIPHGRQETTIVCRYHLLPFQRKAGWCRRLMRWYLTPVVTYFVRKKASKIFNQDHEVCEQIQSVSHQVSAPMRLGKQEERVAWFEQVYARFVRFDD